MVTASGEAAVGVIRIEDDGTYTSEAADGTKSTLQKAAITLNDCLACRYAYGLWSGRGRRGILERWVEAVIAVR